MTALSVVPRIFAGVSASLLVEHGNELLLVGVDGLHHLGVGLAEAEEEGLEKVWLLQDKNPEEVELWHVPEEGEWVGQGWHRRGGVRPTWKQQVKSNLEAAATPSKCPETLFSAEAHAFQGLEIPLHLIQLFILHLLWVF